MTSGVPWQLTGVPARARETAQEAARRAGVSLGEWLDTVILESTRQEAGAQQTRDPDDTPRQIASALSRLDRRLDQLLAERSTIAERRASAAAPAQTDADPAQPAAPGSVSPLDQALDEIAERQRTLDGEQALLRTDLPRASTQDMTALEQHLRNINARIDRLRPCALDSAIETLRDELAEIGVMIKEAMPRHAIEALETEIRALAQRVDSKRYAVSDAADLAGVERGLAEVRDALRALTPAEQLVGFDDVVQALSRKIDGLAATAQDPATLQQLEGAIVGLRSVVSHVASNDGLAKLSEEVRALTAKVEQIVGSDAFAALEQRIAIIADALQSRNQTGPGISDLEAVVQGLADKIERFLLTGADQAVVGELEDRITKLIEKLDSSDARFGHFEAIERGLAELLLQLDAQRASQHDSIEAVHGTLGHIVGRLAAIELGLPGANSGATPSPVLPSAASTSAPSAAQPAPFTPTVAAAAMPVPPTALGNPAPVADRRPIDPSLPPDHPLEPGSGASRGRGGHSPADRIAASEAALGPSRPPVIADPEAKANFIAAARRAAQAANKAAAGRNDSPEQAPRSPRPDADPASQLPSHIKSLVVGTSVLLIMLGSVQLLTGLFSRSDNPLPAPFEEAARTAPADSTGTLSAAEGTLSLPNPPSRQPSLVPGGGSFPPASVDTIADVIVAGAANAPTPPAATTARGPDPAAERLTTGSISAGTTTPAASAPPSAPGRPSGADKLPAGIGNAALRAAAIKGDAAAEFEVAVRFAEGRGTPQDFAAAADWFERAAREGVAPAQFRLGGLYEKGIGVKKDVDRARRLYLAAAEAGNAKAMHNLAVLYSEGIDGKPDYQIAVKWFREAAEHGVADSQYNLGVLYARGIGVEANLAEAFKWFSLAAREGDRESTRKRDEVAARLDHATVMAVRAALQTWTAQPQPEAATQVKGASGWDGAPAAATAKRRGGSDAKVPRSTQ